MSQTTFTPGPWTVQDATSHPSAGDKFLYCEIIASDGCDVANTNGTRTDDEMRANARLIAVAPEMLDALKEARRYLPTGPMIQGSSVCELLFRIDRLLAKATGEAI